MAKILGRMSKEERESQGKKEYNSLQKNYNYEESTIQTYTYLSPARINRNLRQMLSCFYL